MDWGSECSIAMPFLMSELFIVQQYAWNTRICSPSCIYSLDNRERDKGERERERERERK